MLDVMQLLLPNRLGMMCHSFWGFKVFGYGKKFECSTFKVFKAKPCLDMGVSYLWGSC